MSAETTDRIEHLADLLALAARSVRWLAQLRRRPADATRLRTIAGDIDQIARRLRQESRQESPLSEARLH